MKTKEWVNGNHMKFESEHKTFNKQVDSITTGNVIGHVQLSAYVRPKFETNSNGQYFPVGHLQNYDLNWLLKDFPFYVKNFIKQHGEHDSLIAYEFRYWKNGKKIVMGYVVTNRNKKLLQKWALTAKGYSVINEAIEYITE